MKRFLFAIIALALIAAAAYATMLPSSSGERPIADALTHTISRNDLVVAITEQGTLESSNNTEIKCKVRGENTIISVVENGTQVELGDELVKLETLLIEEEISERTKFAHLAEAAVARAQADVTRAEIAISEYLEGRFVSELATLQKDLAIAESSLLSAKNILGYSKMMAESGYQSELDVEEKQFAVAQADLAVSLTKTRIEVLTEFSKSEEMATLQGNLNAAKAKLEAEKERADADRKRLQRAQDEFKQCVITATRKGIVIYPTGKEWEAAPDIEEGATVHKDQILLLMPDLTQMQVKVGIHESAIDRIKNGLDAKVTVLEKTLDGKITSVASVAKPAGWWTGNVVKYDTVVKLPAAEGLKPGMSVEVKVILARHEDVLTIPVSAIMETPTGHVCWVQTDSAPQRRDIQLGDSDSMFAVVQSGVAEGEDVIVDPLANVIQAQVEAAAAIEEARKGR